MSPLLNYLSVIKNAICVTEFEVTLLWKSLCFNKHEIGIRSANFSGYLPP